MDFSYSTYIIVSPWYNGNTVVMAEHAQQTINLTTISTFATDHTIPTHQHLYHQNLSPASPPTTTSKTAKPHHLQHQLTPFLTAINTHKHLHNRHTSQSTPPITKSTATTLNHSDHLYNHHRTATSRPARTAISTTQHYQFYTHHSSPRLPATNTSIKIMQHNYHHNITTSKITTPSPPPL